MSQPTVSINLCVYKPGELLAQALNCMANQETGGRFSFEIVVVDDEPSADTQEAVRKFAETARAPVRCVQTQGGGISHARNTGIRESSGEWIAWFDQDQTAEPDWLSSLYTAAMDSGADWVDGPRDLLLTPDQAARLNPFLRGCLGEMSEGDRIHQVTRRYSSCTGNALVRRSALEKVGLFDEAIVDGWEDWDYVRRFRAHGYACWHAPRAIVHHVIPPERLDDSFFRWHALRVGAAFAARDMREWGLVKTAMSAAARLALAALVHVPKLAAARMRGSETEALEQACRIKRAVSYARKTLHFVSPRLFAQKRYHARLRLRNEARYAERRDS